MKISKVIVAQRKAAVHLNRIAAIFKPGVKLTLIARTPGNNEADFTMSDDDLGEAISALQRRMAADGVRPDAQGADAIVEWAKKATAELKAIRESVRPEALEFEGKQLTSLAGEAINLTIKLLREIVRRSPEVLKHTDIEAFILNELQPAKVMANKDRTACYGLTGLLAKARAERDALPSQQRKIIGVDLASGHDYTTVACGDGTPCKTPNDCLLRGQCLNARGPQGDSK